MKKTALFLTAAMALGSLMGCSGGNTAATTAPDNSQTAGENAGAATEAVSEDSDAASSEEPYEIVIEMLYFGMEDADMQEVIDAINEITLPAINATVSFMPTSFAEMATKPGLWHSSGDKVDVLMTGMMTDPQQLAEQGLLYPLDDLLASSDKLTQLAGDLLQACRYQGVTYAYPLDLYSGNGSAFFYDTALAEEYQITLPESVTTEAELEEVFKAVKDSGMSQYAMTYGDGVLVYHTFGYNMENFGDNYCSRGVILGDGESTEVVNWYASEEYEEMCRLHREWYEAGYLVPDSLSNGYTYYDCMSQGTIFGFISSDGASVGKEYYEKQTGKKLGKVTISEPIMRSSDVVVNTWGISSSCENPEKVMEFMEMVYTDSELSNLLNYGIEGKHYVKTSDSSRLIDYPEGVDPSNMTYGTSVTAGSLGDRTLLYAWSDSWTEESLAGVTQYGVAEAKPSPYLGLNYNMANVVTDNAAVMTVLQKYAPSLGCGVVDVDETLPKFLEELESAGMANILADTQAQVDEYLSSQQ